MTDKRVVLSTAETESEAITIAQALVERKLAACVNIVGPIRSIYRWKGEVENATEFLLLVKTSSDLFDRVHDTIRQLHSYELPECIQLPIEAGSQAYLDWISESVLS
ncbi:MAG TPA: divalent-cation tolerance protein CutA [Terriglobales bacterium]|nr:divalent-cation tolerance protein CutA [Terriglobales bacterium]